MALSADGVRMHAGQIYNGPRKQTLAVRAQRRRALYDAAKLSNVPESAVIQLTEAPVGAKIRENIIHSFKQFGFVVLKSVLTAERADLAKKEVERLVRTFDPSIVSFEPGFTPSSASSESEKALHVRKLRDFVGRSLSEVLSGVAQDERLMMAVAACLEAARHGGFQAPTGCSDAAPKSEEAVGAPQRPHLSQDIALIKQPGGTEKPPHQDSAYFLLRPGGVCGVWIALEPTDADNGCMHVIPGSHRLGPRPHYCDLDCMLPDDEWTKAGGVPDDGWTKAGGVVAAASEDTDKNLSAQESLTMPRDGKGAEAGGDGDGDGDGEGEGEGEGHGGGGRGRGRGKGKGKGKGSHGSIVSIAMEPGDALLFSDLVFHATPCNDSDRGRTAVQYHYRAEDAEAITVEEHGRIFHDDGGPAGCMVERAIGTRKSHTSAYEESKTDSSEAASGGGSDT